MKLNNLIILLIFVVPIIFYTLMKGAEANPSVKLGEKPVVIMVSSSMCGECKKMDVIVQEVFPEFENKIDFKKMYPENEETQQYIKKYNITLTPTFLMFNKKGDLKKKIEGAVTKENFKNYLEELNNG